MAKTTRSDSRVARHGRVRKKVKGTAERPRLCVFRSSKHIYAQIIDDTTGHTLAAAGSVEPGSDKGSTQDGALAVGKKVAERAKAAGIKAVVFDRGGFRYQGRIAKVAEGARAAGLEF
ncbi:MAG: 50S ribosomal protein L18 [Fimbriimonadaceae bacterium]